MTATTSATGSDFIRQALLGRMEQDASVVVLGEALELSAATMGLLARFPGRVHLLPAADATLVGVAVGMALGGKRPVVELAEPEAVWGVLQQLGQEAGTLRDRGEFSAPVVLRVPVRPDAWDPTTLLETLQGVSVAVVGQPGEAALLLQSALGLFGPGPISDPVVILEPLYVMAQRGAALDPLPLGRARVVRSGEHATVLALGDQVAAAIDAADVLARDGVEVEVLDLRWLRPIDVDAIRTSVAKTGRAIVAGTSTHALATAVREAFLRLESPPVVTAGSGSEGLVASIRSSVQF